MKKTIWPNIYSFESNIQKPYNFKKFLRKKYFYTIILGWKTLYVFTFSMYKYFCSRKTGSQNYKWLQGLLFRE